MELLNKLTDHLKADALLISDEANMRYWMGFCGEGFVLFHKDKFYILTDSRYTQSSIEETKGKNCEVITVQKEESMLGVLSKLVKDNNIKSLGFEAEYINYLTYMSLRDKLDGVSMVVTSIDSFRMVKTADELAKIRQAESIGDKAFERVLFIVREGMTEIQLAAEIEYGMKQNGAEHFSFDTIVASGINGDKPHAVPTEKVIKKGELITMDFGCKYRGYCSDMTRTIALGKANDKQKNIYDIVAQAHLAGRNAIKKGVTGKEVDAAARKVIEQAGYGRYFGHGLGHSLGLKIHEDPRFSATCDTEILPNMLMTVEPGIYIPGELGVRIEDLVVIKEDGYEFLSHSNREFIEIDR